MLKRPNIRRRNWDRYGNYGGSFELRQTALNAGYNEGIRAGNNDRQNGRHSNYRDSNAYQEATKDYSSRLGDRELYRRYFREAFENGYNTDGYVQDNRDRDDRYSNRDRNDNGNRNRRGRNCDGYGNFGGSFQLRQTALNAGYNEGMKQGQKDRNKRNSNTYQDQSAYRKPRKTTVLVSAIANCTGATSVRRTRTATTRASGATRASHCQKSDLASCRC